ncbi:hypothetical protein [Orrella sp. 11846]|uniref:hypothetical protein n=1 Tax=Orrella sp. 11846 TaxID=3409913 RepID=UPI003B5B25A5
MFDTSTSTTNALAKPSEPQKNNQSVRSRLHVSRQRVSHWRHFVTTVSLMLCVNSVMAQTSDEKLLGAPDRGWEALAEMLDVLTPSINTELTPSGTEVTNKIEALINQGQARQALEQIEARETVLATSTSPGTDVQLMFQKARALQALKRDKEAQAIYQDMTFRFPELAQPWNNLAILYIREGRLDEAEQALLTANSNDPRFGQALANLADVRLLQAMRDYREASRLGTPGAKQRLKQLEAVFGQTRP